MSEEKFIRIEHRLDGHDKDIHSIAESLKGINTQAERTNQILQSLSLKEERFIARIEKVESGIGMQVETVKDIAVRSHKRIDKLDGIISRIGWLVITMVIVGVLGAVMKFGV